MHDHYQKKFAFFFFFFFKREYTLFFKFAFTLKVKLLLIRAVAVLWNGSALARTGPLEEDPRPTPFRRSEFSLVLLLSTSFVEVARYLQGTCLTLRGNQALVASLIPGCINPPRRVKLYFFFELTPFRFTLEGYKVEVPQWAPAIGSKVYF